MSDWQPPKPPGDGGDGNAPGTTPEGGVGGWQSADAPPDPKSIPLEAPQGLPPMPGDAEWLTSGTPAGGSPGPSASSDAGGWLPPSAAAQPPSGGGGGGWQPPGGAPPSGGGGWQPPAGAPPGGGGGWQPPGGAPPGGGGGGWQPPGGAPPGGGGGWQPPGGPEWGPSQLAAEAGVVRVGDILSTAMRVVSGNFGAFAVVCLGAVLPGLVVTQYFSTRMQTRILEVQGDLMSQQLGYGGSPDDPFAMLGRMFDPTDFIGMCGGGFLSFVFTYLAQATLMYATVEHLAGRHAPIGAAISRGLSRGLSVLGAALLIVLMQVVVALPAIGIGVLGALAGPAGACCGVGFMFVGILVPLFWVLVVTFVTIPAAVTENVGPIAAIQRSFELTKGHRVTILLVFLCLMGAIFTFACIGGMCSGALSGGGIDMATGMPKPPSAFAQGVSFVVTLITSVVQTMALASLAAVTYARIRGVRDGVDANALAEVFS
ncbi:MAG: hypothetical protein KF901_25885 [Myxococcales bacterium]|nr:hypothetical protein [Myxococcales bacterium]